MSFAVGHNVAGYSPDDECSLFETFEEARAYLIHHLLWEADQADQVEPSEDGSSLALLAEDVNLWSGPDSVAFTPHHSAHALPRVFWIQESDEEVTDDE